MKPGTKLKLRKWALMTLKAIVWSVDEWLHAQELRLRKDLEQLGSARGVVTSLPPKPRPQFGSGDGAASVKRAGELRAPAPTGMVPAPIVRLGFDEWEARRSGFLTVHDGCKTRGKSRGMPARAFDLGSFYSNRIKMVRGK
jgi:hypothetical protein